MIKIRILLENTCVEQGIVCRHGLSMYVETPAHKVLFDVGPDDAFLKNALLLSADISSVDTAVLSHGHYDHGGGLETFFRVNAAAPLYLRRAAMEPHYSVAAGKTPRDIGLSPALEQYRERLRFTEAAQRIDQELLLFSEAGPSPVPISSNQRLRRKEGDTYPQDDFRHEQHLLVTSGGKAVLLAGCAHSGVIPIMERCVELLGRAPDVVLGGFHLYSPGSGETEPAERVREIGCRLKTWPSVYYTGHCTGETAFGQMKEILGEQLQPMSGGMEVHIF